MVENNIDSWPKPFGGIGLILLIFAAALLDAPIFSLLALPVFMIGMVICMMFLLSLRGGLLSRKRRWLGFILIISGVVGFSLTLGCISVQFVEYSLPLNAAEWINVFITLVSAVITTSITTLGICQRTGWRGKRIRLVWAKIFSLAPLVVVVIKLLEFYDVPFGT